MKLRLDSRSLLRHWELGPSTARKFQTPLFIVIPDHLPALWSSQFLDHCWGCCPHPAPGGPFGSGPCQKKTTEGPSVLRVCGVWIYQRGEPHHRLGARWHHRWVYDTLPERGTGLLRGRSVSGWLKCRLLLECFSSHLIHAQTGRWQASHGKQRAGRRLSLHSPFTPEALCDLEFPFQ